MSEITYYLMSSTETHHSSWLVGDNNLQFTDTGNTLPTLKDWAPDVQNYCRDSALIKNHGIVVRTGPLTDIGKNKSMSLLKYTDGSRACEWICNM